MASESGASLKERFDFDGTLKELFQNDRPTLLKDLSGGVRVRQFLNVELPKVQQRRVDLAILMEDDTILHIEIQSTNDRKIAFRMGHYYLLLKEQHRLPVKQVLLYVGGAPMAMPDRVAADGNLLIYRLLDVRQFDAGVLAATGRRADLALAVLAGGGDVRLPEIIKRAARLKGRTRSRIFAQILILAGLRGLEDKLEWELRHQGVVIDITKNKILMRWQREFLAEGEAKGEAKGRAEGKAEGMTIILHDQLETKFGALPKWADTRLTKANPAQLERWAKKILTASSLEGVLGRARTA